LNLEGTLLSASGALAMLGGLAGVFLGMGRRVSLLAGAALLLLGLQHFGWVLAITAPTSVERNFWLDVSFVGVLLVSLAWLLLSVIWGRDEDPGRGWRIYAPLQAALSLAALAALHRFSPIDRFAKAENGALPLTPFGVLVLGALLLNVTLLTANFEATYLALSTRWRRAFRPALLSVVFGSALYGYGAAAAILLGRVSLWGICLASVPVAIVTPVLPYVLIRRRAAEATVTAPIRPLYETGSLVLGILLLGFLAVVVQVARLTGRSLEAATWLSIIVGAVVGLVTITLSGRLQRLLRHLLEPYFYASRFDPEVVWSGLSQKLDNARTHSDLYALIPATTVEIAGVEPVTLFLVREGGGEYFAAGTTLADTPSERIGKDEPLARELCASRHAISLRGRPDDLGLIPIYVENAKQIAACQAACAVPLSHAGELLGFLLCGDPARGADKLSGTLFLLEVIAQMVTTRLISLDRER
jgi:hypothetical protein